MEKDKQIKFSIQKRNREFVCKCGNKIKVPKSQKGVIYHCSKCFKRIYEVKT